LTFGVSVQCSYNKDDGRRPSFRLAAHASGKAS
jgi:hypothetical protein